MGVNDLANPSRTSVAASSCGCRVRGRLGLGCLRGARATPSFRAAPAGHGRPPPGPRAQTRRSRALRVPCMCPAVLAFAIQPPRHRWARFLMML